MVHRRQNQHRPQCARPPRQELAQEQGGHDLGSGRWRTAHLTYFQLNAKSTASPISSRRMGVKKGDTVTIYMGRVTELPIAMLASAKIGAIHSVVYGGFRSRRSPTASPTPRARLSSLVMAPGCAARSSTSRTSSTRHQGAPMSSASIVLKRTGQQVNMVSTATTGGMICCSPCQPQVRNRGDGCRRPDVHPLYQRHNRQAQGLMHTCGGYQVTPPPPLNMSLTRAKMTAGGAPLTRAGSQATATSSMHR